MNRWRTVTAVVCALVPLYAGDYFATNILEPDKMGTAWLLKRFVDRNAGFFFVPKDSVVPNAMSFDMPASKYRRYPNCSAAMSVIRLHGITDSGAVRIARLFDEIELGFWGEGKSRHAHVISERIMRIIEAEKDTSVIIEKCFLFLDSVAAVTK